MRTAVILLNALSVIAALAVEPLAFYVGAWGLLGASYGDPSTTLLGAALMPAPLVVAGLGVWLSVRRMRAGAPGAVAIAAAPLAIFACVGAALAFVFSG